MRSARVYMIYRKNLEDPLPRLRARAPIRVTQATLDEIDAIAAINPGPEDLSSLYRRRLSGGYRCFVARIEGEPVAYNWLLATRGTMIDYDGQVIRIGEGEVFCTDAFTAEAWRGRAIHTELLLRMLEWAREEGFRTAWTKVDATLRRSWKTHERLKWSRTGRFLHVRRFLGIRAWMLRLSGSTHPVAGLQPGHEGW